MAHPKTIYLIRHGQTDHNAQRILQGSSVDASLNQVGKAQARYFYECYREVPFDLVITSELRRTRESVADFIAAGIDWEEHPDINEICLGGYEGKQVTPECKAEMRAVKEGWETGKLDGRIGGGESARELGERLERFIRQLRDRQERHVLICSHGGAMSGLITRMMGKPLSTMNALRHYNLGLWTAEQEADGRFTFHLMNDRGHLPVAPKLSQ